jgi:hypothetical protein
VALGSGGNYASFFPQQPQQARAYRLSEADEARFSEKLRDLAGLPPVVARKTSGRWELAHTWFDYAGNNVSGRTMAQARTTGDDGVHLIYMQLMPQGGNRSVVYGWIDPENPALPWFPCEIQNRGWPRVLNGQNDAAIVAFHGNGAWLFSDACEACCAFTQRLHLPNGISSGFARQENVVVFICQLINWLDGDTVLVSSDYMQSWTGHNIIPPDSLTTDMGVAEIWPSINPQNPNEFSFLYAPDVTATAPNGSICLATSYDLGLHTAAWKLATTTL